MQRRREKCGPGVIWVARPDATFVGALQLASRAFGGASLPNFVQRRGREAKSAADRQGCWGSQWCARLVARRLIVEEPPLVPGGLAGAHAPMRSIARMSAPSRRIVLACPN